MLSQVRHQFLDSSTGQPVGAGVRVTVRDAASNSLLRLYGSASGGLISMFGQTFTDSAGYVEFYINAGISVSMHAYSRDGAPLSLAPDVTAGTSSSGADLAADAAAKVNSMRSGTSALGTFNAAQVTAGAQWAAGVTSGNALVLGDGSIDGGVVNIHADVTIDASNAATYNAKLAVLSAAHTITIAGDIPNFSLLVRPPASGAATIAVTNSAHVNGGTTSVSKTLADVQAFGVMWFATNNYFAQ